MSDKEKFAGFDESIHKKYRKEARQKYGDEAVNSSEAIITAWSDVKKASVWKDGEDIARELAALMGGPPDAPEAAALAKRQHDFIKQFWDCDIEAFQGMGKLYAEDERFTAFYDNYAPGLAGFFRQVIDVYVDNNA